MTLQAASRLSPAERVLALEQEDARLYALLRRTLARREAIRAHLTRLRLRFTGEDQNLYDALRSRPAHERRR